jgi:hypothetical protein
MLGCVSKRGSDVREGALKQGGPCPKGRSALERDGPRPRGRLAVPLWRVAGATRSVIFYCVRL